MRKSGGMPALEIAVTSAAGARVALENGADRVELCAALELGGITPSQGLVEAAAEVGIPLHVLIRPRPGGFVFDSDEVSLLERETITCLRSGAAGVVIGALTSEGTLDRAVIDRLTDLARGERPDAEVTVHRAIDRSADPAEAVASLVGSQITRVLTSGGAARAGLGRGVLRRMVSSASDFDVMAGGGVTVADIGDLREIGVAAVHLSAKAPAERTPKGAGSRIPLGTADSAADLHFVTDPAVVAAARAALDVQSPGPTP